jgi:hypothetical protein
MTIYSTGEMSARISEKDLKELKIPLPENHVEIGDFLRQVWMQIERHESAIEDSSP